MRPSTEISLTKRMLRYPMVALGALSLTAVFFLVLPLLQAMSTLPPADTLVRQVDTTQLPPPPPPPEDEPEDEPEQEEKPPELNEAPPLDLSQLEMALNPGFGEGSMSSDFGVRLNNLAGVSGEADMFSMSDLDQTPRPTYRSSPVMTKKLLGLGGGKVILIFMVNERGRVVQPIVESSSNPAFERAALDAIKKWRFEPGKRSGQPVSFRMRQPITFPKA
jgi:protein TonB